MSTLLYCMGEEADAVLTSTNITADERKVYATVLGKFDGFFKVRTNTIYERARFNRRDQQEGESAEQYITALYSLVETCNYGNLQDELLRDRLVVGIRDAGLSEKLQMDAGLTLEKAKTAIRQKEAVKEQQQTLQEGTKSNPIFVEEVKYPQRGQGRGRFRGGRYRPQNQQCIRCGYDRHPPGYRCPATNASCFKCNRVGHFGAKCPMPRAQADTNELNIDSAYLDAISTEHQSSWST